MAEKSSPGKLKGFLAEARKLPAGLNRFRGEMFQTWVRTHGYGQLAKLNPEFAKGTKLGQKKVANTFLADELVEHNDFVQVLEIKDVTLFDPKVIEQAQKMDHVIKRGGKYKGKKVEVIDYVFSDLNGAKLHGKDIVDAMKRIKPTIYYFNEKGILKKL